MRRLSLFATACLAPVLLAEQALAQSTPSDCTPATVLVLLDRSTSMRETLAGTTTSKWTLAKSALEAAVGQYQMNADFGLTVFPDKTYSCAGGKDLIAPESNALQDFQTKLDGSTYAPAVNMWTPLGQVLGNVSDEPYMGDTSKRRFVILLTDGQESCPTTADRDAGIAEIVPATQGLADMGIETFVIGFGEATKCNPATDPNCDGVNAKVLNQIALYGGTKRFDNCDPNGTDPASPSNCYYQADDQQALVAALQEIATKVVTESCDAGCGSGSRTCTNGVWSTCQGPTPVVNMCTGEMTCGPQPPFCGCNNGDTRPCPDGSNVGECKIGTETCVNHEWGACMGGQGPTNQSECDGKDHNCDGKVDTSGCQCKPGTVDPTCDDPHLPAPCHPGTRTCDANGQWGACVGAKTDCECTPGEVDDGCDDPHLPLPCHPGTRTCGPDGHWGACTGAQGPQPETCDGIDNNCDGIIDNPSTTSTDDVPHGLCGADQVCQSGQCVTPPPVVTPPGSHNVGGEATGCACRVGGKDELPPGGVLSLLVVAAFVAIRLRRSR